MIEKMEIEVYWVHLEWVYLVRIEDYTVCLYIMWTSRTKVFVPLIQGVTIPHFWSCVFHQFQVLYLDFFLIPCDIYF